MQISSNTTGMEAGLCVACDKKGRSICVVVVKGTFTVREDGTTVLAEEQVPLVSTDQHYGDPESTPIKYECDFAAFKPQADIIVNSHAYSPSGKSTEQVDVALTFENRVKTIRVFGDRHWERSIAGLRHSRPAKFIKMPLVFDRAFGGSELSDNPKYRGTDTRNPVGVGYHRDPDVNRIVGTPLPNLENPKDTCRNWNDKPQPVGYGVVGRNWQPRVAFAGTYNDSWIERRFPFLPDDFNDKFFQAAPVDQQCPYPKGGERLTCINMTPNQVFAALVPTMKISAVFRFLDRNVEHRANMDTIVVEPDEQRVLSCWRIRVPLAPKMHALEEVHVACESQ